MTRQLLILIPLVATLMMACSTQKNTWLSRGYQKTISAYNVYHNGNEAFKAGIVKIREASPNDFSNVLPVYEFADASTAKAGSSDMETALRKGHKLIQLHSITVKPKRKQEMSEKDKRFYAKDEFNPYVDKAFLLIGKANVVHHDEEDAIAVFDYLSRKFDGGDASYEGRIWKSIAYAQTAQYVNAQTALESYDLDGLAPENLYGQYMAAYANIFICQKKYAEAIPYMEKAVNEADSRPVRRRYNYILAQLYRAVGRNADAAPLFLKISKGANNDDMTFAAKLDLATVATTDEEIATAEKKLRKMAVDAKNEDRLDQIYYSLGKLEEQRDNQTQAIGYYNKSVETSTINTNQKGFSFLALGDIYLARPQYLEAGISLDSAAFYLDDTNQRKAETTELATTLRPLTRQLKNIAYLDSLLRVASMSERDRNRLLDSIVDAARRAEREREEARLAAEEEAMSQSEYSSISNSVSQGSAQKWYFYNSNLISAGKSTFLGKWGQRANADDWRRSNKSQMNTEEAEEGEEMIGEDGEVYQKVNDDFASQADDNQRVTRESLLAGLPLTDADKDSVNNIVCNALFASGAILYNDIADYPSAIEQLQTLLRRYPNCPQRYNALVMLYFAQIKTDDNAAAARTRQIIESEYPDTDFARYLQSDSYFDDKAAELAKREEQYRNAYTTYLQGDYSSAATQSTLAQSDSANADYAPKYLLVRSISYAKQAQTTAFRTDLQTIVNQYPGGEEAELAQKFLDLLGEGKEPVKAQRYDSPLESAGHTLEGSLTAASNYEYMPDTTHTIICLIDVGMQNKAQFVIADYNFSNFLLEDFDIYHSNLPDARPTITIHGFADQKAAMNYFYALREQPFWSDISSSSIPEIYVVSDNNLKLVVLTAISAEYVEFFKDNYLKP